MAPVVLIQMVAEEEIRESEEEARLAVWEKHSGLKSEEMEKGVMKGKFTFKTLPDGSVNRTKVICMYC